MVSLMACDSVPQMAEWSVEALVGWLAVLMVARMVLATAHSSVSLWADQWADAWAASGADSLAQRRAVRKAGAKDC